MTIQRRLGHQIVRAKVLGDPTGGRDYSLKVNVEGCTEKVGWTFRAGLVEEF